MADEPNTAPLPAEQSVFSFPAPVTWALKGKASSKNLDLTVEFCVEAGLSVTYTAPGLYRASGTLKQITKVAEWIALFKPAPISFGPEQPPEHLSMRFEVRPDRPPPRVAEVHGLNESERPVARAIDAGLTVQRVGIKLYRVTGQTRYHVAWVASLFNVSTERALQIMNLTAAQAAAEDVGALPPINVVLPTRQTLSEITRDAHGSITQVKQTERSVKP
jgi:hypothetical protein